MIYCGVNYKQLFAVYFVSTALQGLRYTPPKDVTHPWATDIFTNIPILKKLKFTRRKTNTWIGIGYC